jgi:hypothetical protein
MSRSRLSSGHVEPAEGDVTQPTLTATVGLGVPPTIPIVELFRLAGGHRTRYQRWIVTYGGRVAERVAQGTGCRGPDGCGDGR